jgi:hypothetical protein
VADYTGSRRAVEPLSPAAAANAFAEDDAASVCPECGAGVRPGQEWCTLCLHVLREPEPRPEPVTVHRLVTPELTPPLTPAPEVLLGEPGADVNGEPDGEADPGTVGPSSEARARAEAAAEALLAQLKVESRHDRLNVPEYLNSKSRIAAFVPVAMVVLCGLGIATLTVLGSIFG